MKIVTDSVASIPAELARAHDIDVVTLYINYNNVEYEDATMDLDKFYSEIDQMIDNPPTSSQPSQHTLETFFEDAAKAHEEVLGIFISTGLSGTYDSAVRIARSVQSRNSDFRYEIIDSQSCGYDEAYPVLVADKARKEGKNLKECAQAVLDAIESTRFLFSPQSLTFLQKGGRIGNAAALLGNLIQICPVLTVTDGTPEVVAKVRTHRKALERMVHKIKEDAEEYGLKNLVVHYIGDKMPAVQWARDVIEPLLGHEVEVLPVSPVVGLHVGPAVGVAYECAKKVKGKITKPVQHTEHLR